MRVYPWLKETGTIFSRQIRGRSAPLPAGAKCRVEVVMNRKE